MSKEKERLLGASAPASVNKLEGVEVSLNLMNRIFFGLPGSNFELNVSKPTGKLPDHLNEWQVKQLRRAIKFSELVIGGDPVREAPKQTEALDAYLAILKTPAMQFDAIQSMVNGIVNIPDGDPKIGRFTRFEVLDKLFEVETTGMARASVLEYLTQAKDYVPGPEKPVDEPGPLVAAPGAGGAVGTSAAAALAEAPSQTDLDSI